MFTEPERLALAGFLAGYTGLTREAYALHLRQYATWCSSTTSAIPGAAGLRDRMSLGPMALPAGWRLA